MKEITRVVKQSQWSPINHTCRFIKGTLKYRSSFDFHFLYVPAILYSIYNKKDRVSLSLWLYQGRILLPHIENAIGFI